MKFKIGDKVKVVASKEELGIGRERYSGCVFTIESVNRTFVYPKLLYGVNDEDCLVFYENELEFVEEDKKMKTIKIIVDGKEIEAQVNEDDLTQIGKEKSNRQDEGNPYYYIDAWMTAELDYDKNDDYTEQLYDCGNYFSTEKDCVDAARAVSLWLRLKRWVDEKNRSIFDFADHNQKKYYIYFNYDNNRLEVNDLVFWKDIFQIYFDSEETARQAIEEFKDDLMWYFTEFGKEL